MSKPVKPGWPESGVFPFLPFPLPGASSGAAPPLMQGLTGSIDLMKDFWGRLPGGAPLPGFLVPTVDVEELDKRIADLKAAQSWVEINLNLLRTTIQGLEVQRHTIAAIRSLATPIEKSAAIEEAAAPAWPATSAAHPAESAPPANGVAADWLGYLQEQFAKVAQAATTTGTSATKTAVRKPVARQKKSKPTPKSSRKTATDA